MNEDEKRALQAQSNIDELSERVAAELEIALSFKSSMESRAIAIFALNLGISTLYLGLREQLLLPGLLPSNGFFWVLVASLALSGLSLVAAVVSAWPGFYRLFGADAFDEMYENAWKADSRLRANLMTFRIQQLRKIRSTNTRKAVWIVLAFSFAGASVAGFAVAIVAASNVTP